MNQKGFVNIIIIVVIVVLAGAGAYFVLNRQAQLTPTPTPTPTPGAPTSGPITVNGEIICLPKGAAQQTLECAIGLKGLDGQYYGLPNLYEHDPEYKFTNAVGVHVSVSGVFNPREMLGPDGNKYGVIGMIDVISIKEVTKGPAIENISPLSGSMGTKVIIRGSGFTPNDNDVAFTHPGIDFQGRHTAYLNRISSKDGKTVSFNLPDTLGVCAYSRLNQNEACPEIGMSLPKGAVQISVVNKNGISNTLTFTVK